MPTRSGCINPGDLYSADRHQLHRHRARRGLCRPPSRRDGGPDGLATGLGATAALFVLGALREILGNGTLFDGADLLLGHWARALRIELFHTDTPFLLAILPPGAFLGLGFMLAFKYVIEQKRRQRQAQRSAVGQALRGAAPTDNHEQA